MYNTLAILNRGLIERKKHVILSNTNKNLLIVKIFYSNGYIFNYSILYNKIQVEFNIYNDKLIFNALKTYKSFSTRKYITLKQLKRMVFLENKKLILTTNLGILDSNTALKKNVGGCILFEFK